MAEDNSEPTKDVSKKGDSKSQSPWDKLKKKCDKAGIKLTEENFLQTSHPAVHIPAGKGEHVKHLMTDKTINKFLKVPFEKYICLQDYDAICSYGDGIIEAIIHPLFHEYSHDFVKGVMTPTGQQQSTFNLKVSSQRKDGIDIHLSKSSDVMRELTREFSSDSSISLIVRNAKVNQHDDAQELLVRLADSFFFELDRCFGFTFTLQRARLLRLRRRPDFMDSPKKDITFPEWKYDADPMSIYWYARSARDLPLLQFLAYYQVIEYYFPTYAQAAAKKDIQDIHKKPTFQSDCDADIRLILSELKSCASVLSDEKKQMEVTLQECITHDELLEFLSSDDDRKEYYSNQISETLSIDMLHINDSKADLRINAARRIYDIRCKIVHTKSDTSQPEVKSILPFSKEVEQLHFDIDLAHYLAQKVLIKASSRLDV